MKKAKVEYVKTRISGTMVIDVEIEVVGDSIEDCLVKANETYALETYGNYNIGWNRKNTILKDIELIDSEYYFNEE